MLIMLFDKNDGGGKYFVNINIKLKNQGIPQLFFGFLF